MWNAAVVALVAVLASGPSTRAPRYPRSVSPYTRGVSGPVVYVGDRVAVLNVFFPSPVQPPLNGVPGGPSAMLTLLPLDGRGAIELQEPRLDVRSGRVRWSTALPARGQLTNLYPPFYCYAAFDGPALTAGTRADVVASFRMGSQSYAFTVRDVVVGPSV